MKRKNKLVNYIWICSTDGTNSHIGILTQSQQIAESIKDVASFDLAETLITTIEFVKGNQFSVSFNEDFDESGLAADTVWLGNYYYLL